MPKGVQRHSIFFIGVRTLIACAVSMFHIKDLKVIKMIHFLLFFIFITIATPMKYLPYPLARPRQIPNARILRVITQERSAVRITLQMTRYSQQRRYERTQAEPHPIQINQNHRRYLRSVKCKRSNELSIQWSVNVEQININNNIMLDDSTRISIRGKEKGKLLTQSNGLKIKVQQWQNQKRKKTKLKITLKILSPMSTDAPF